MGHGSYRYGGLTVVSSVSTAGARVAYHHRRVQLSRLIAPLFPRNHCSKQCFFAKSISCYFRADRAAFCLYIRTTNVSTSLSLLIDALSGAPKDKLRCKQIRSMNSHFPRVHLFALCHSITTFCENPDSFHMPFELGPSFTRFAFSFFVPDRSHPI